MKKSVFIIPLILIGCGGDDKSNTLDTQPNKTYSLEKVVSLKSGVVYSSELFDSATTQYGFIAIENKPETVINGVMVTPQYRYFTVKNSRHGSGNISAPIWETTSYIDTATKNLISFTTFASQTGMGTRINCSSTSPYHFPAQVKSGDSDITPGFTCDNNITIAPGNWRAESTTSGHLDFIVQAQTVDISGSLINEVTTYTLDSGGAIVSLKINNLKSFSD
ncbi:hypothetical protein [Cellvibrio sp. OA-2007]|uniref:hypothetical protein n=1 Tax=Cellvibrio sp. OA-2007 TaxID=529823 RepID=UPI000780A49A|nr:hypothetical protein [Cellvibrio sp. OA-2007]